MTYSPSFTGWQNITLNDLIIAYRKAKTDCFFNSNFPTASKFADYEEDLITNLERLLYKLQKNQGFIGLHELFGNYKIIPKKLSLEPKPKEEEKKENSEGDCHVYFSDPKKHFKHLKRSKKLIPEFRLIGDFPVDTHVISALWINMVGCKFDALLSEDCYAYRLRRFEDGNQEVEKQKRKFHISAIGSFWPYFGPYKKWRDNGIRKIENYIKSNIESTLIAISLDLKSYYHKLYPDFFSTEIFQKSIGINLSIEEAEFTQQMSQFLCAWSDNARDEIKKFGQIDQENNSELLGGLVIGLSASCVIANIALHKWDELIRKEPSLVYYGRYVDDMLLVIKAPPNVEVFDAKSFMDYLSQKILGDEKSEKVIDGKNNKSYAINLGSIFAKSQIELQTSKQKLFILKGQAGLNLISKIKENISEVVSERRLMPEIKQFEQSLSAKVLIANEDATEEANTLRKADGLSIRRSGLSIEIKRAETMAHDLPKKAWEEDRKEFYELLDNHILREDLIFDYYKSLQRLFGISIKLKDVEHLESMIKRCYEIVDNLSRDSENEVVINGHKLFTSNKDIWECVKESFKESFYDAVIRYYPITSRLQDIEKSIPESDWDNIKVLLKSSALNIEDNAFKIFTADLAQIPYREIFEDRFRRRLIADSAANYTINKDIRLIEKVKQCDIISFTDLKNFLDSTHEIRFGEGDKFREPILPFLFPTRPLSTAKISEYAIQLPNAIRNNSSSNSFDILESYIRAIKGVKIIDSFSDTKDKTSNRRLIKIGKNHLKKDPTKENQVILAISSIKSDDEDFIPSIEGNPNLSKKRYMNLARLINQVMALNPRPDYLILPELSLPLEWLDSFVNALQRSKINLIAGTEYRHYKNNKVCSEAHIALNYSGFGYDSVIRIRQPKLEPALHEEEELRKHKKEWAYLQNASDNPKPVFIHNGFHFGVIICSELLNSKERISFQGQVDALMVLCWNQDLETFSSIVESCALDIHAYIALVNNRKYGDSRVRSPAQEGYKRDLAKLKGGESDFCVTVKLDIKKLREFQNGFCEKSSICDVEKDIENLAANILSEIPEGKLQNKAKELIDHIKENYKLKDFRPFKPLPNDFSIISTRDIITNKYKAEKEGKDFYSFPDITEEDLKIEFKEAILNYFSDDAKKGLDLAIEKCFSNLRKPARFGSRKDYQVVWYDEAGYVIDYRDAKNILRWGKGNIKYKDRYEKRVFSRRELIDSYRNREIAIKKELEDLEKNQKKVAERIESYLSKLSNSKKECWYLKEKEIFEVDIPEIKYDGESIVIPIYDLKHKVWSSQTIRKKFPIEYPIKSFKKFASGGKLKGNFFVIRSSEELELSKYETIYFAEGFATAASIFIATNTPVVVCFSVSWVDTVLSNFLEEFPEKNYIVACDNDAWKEVNAGMKLAEHIFSKYQDYKNVKVTIPKFTEEQRGIKNIQNPSDFNDLHRICGKEAVVNQLSKTFGKNE